jgi:hypothetical protein
MPHRRDGRRRAANSVGHRLGKKDHGEKSAVAYSFAPDKWFSPGKKA